MSKRTYSLRETINTSLDHVGASTDAVLFEFGPSRQQDLALRSRIRMWQTQLRVLFVMQTTWLKYRLQLPGFELPKAIRVAQQEFDEHLAGTLEDMADRIEGKAQNEKADFEDSFERLEQEIRTCCSEEPQEELVAKLQTFLTLCRRIERLMISLWTRKSGNGNSLACRHRRDVQVTARRKSIVMQAVTFHLTILNPLKEGISL